MFVDTHCHLNFENYLDDRAAAVDRAVAAGVELMVVVGTDEPSTAQAIELAERHPSIVAAAGCHPHEADRCSSDADFEPIRRHAAHPRVAAVGETGLDYFRNPAPPERQKTLFLRHIRLALELRKPLILHCRDAHADCVEILRAEGRGLAGGVAHCFSGSADNARAFLDLGFHVSIAGPITYPNAGRLRDAAATIPSDRLLIETDAPFLPPQPWRGKRNEPSYIVESARVLAGVRGVTLATLGESTTANARRLFACNASSV